MLSRATINSIESMVDLAFDSAKEVFLGIVSNGKRLVISANESLTLPALFEAASRDEGGIPNISTLNSLVTIASNYIESSRAKTKADVINQIQAFVDEGAFSEKNTIELKEKIRDSLSKILEKAKDDLNKIFDTEAQKTKAFASLDGIVRVNAVQDISDPIVFWIVTKAVNGEDGPCKECVKIHLMPDKVTPRLWKMSEVSMGYHVMGEDKPSIAELHPHGRCVLTTLLPGFGFDSTGRVTYISDGFDALEEQRR